jgi:flagellin-like protein
MIGLLKSRRALSPVVASIILIAVTVAVGIAVAAWMGALTISFTRVHEKYNFDVPIPIYPNATHASFAVEFQHRDFVPLPWNITYNSSSETLILTVTFWRQVGPFAFEELCTKRYMIVAEGS